MTILGVPEGQGFAIGTSSNIAPETGKGGSMDMSLGEFVLTFNISILAR